MTHQKNTQETIEFFTPKLGLTVEPYIAAEQRQGIHHVGRYQWASLVLAARKPKRIIDVACGAGYGSFMLAQACGSSGVTGVDYDPRAVEYASRNYSRDNLLYRTGSMVTWRDGEEPLGEVEAVVTFDTIEHLLHRELALESIVENLSDDGILLISTPCGHAETRLNPGWMHHKVEFSHRDLFRFLSRYFERVIQPQDNDFPSSDFWRDFVNKDKMHYLNRMNPVVCLGPKRAPPYKQLI